MKLIETIRIQNGRVRHIKYHNFRFNETRRKLFNIHKKVDLRALIDTSNATHSSEVKCRVLYNESTIDIEYEAYILRPIKTLKTIEIGQFEYNYKYADRSKLNHFFSQRGNHDDILMTRDGIITDTYYANVALLKNTQWYTPKHPLLMGTNRARLLHKNKVMPTDIHIDQIHQYEAISIFNAMIPFKKIIIDL
ncbi:MAG: aminotransferase class IV [Saprospiraceae bacterium]|nr:aminotransferase class IV [Saprospiraceae bacterium]